MKVKQFLTPYMRSFCYVIIEDSSVIIIDPCELDEVKQLLQASALDISCCILTHEHYDHISGLDWMHTLGIPVIASEKCNENLADVRLNQSRYYDVFCMLQKRLENDVIPEVKEYRGYADEVFNGELFFKWKGHSILLKETPGHSQGSICILIDKKYLFCGDTLFSEVDTNCNILGGEQKDLEKISMPWLESLDKDIMVYPGHYEIFYLGERLEREKV